MFTSPKRPFYRSTEKLPLDVLPEVIDHNVIVQCVEQILNKEQDDYRKLINMLSLNQKQVLIAIAKEQIVSELTGREFLRQHNQPAASSVQRATEFLIDKEYLYRTENGYVVYDRFMSLWIRRNY